MRSLSAAALCLALLAVVPATAQPVVSVEFATPGVTFARPVGVEVAPGSAERLFVLEQGSPQAPSRILTLAPSDAQATVFLDLSDRIVADGEAGLLGLAFHPDYATNGRLFVSYTAPPGDTGVLTSHIAEFARSASDPLVADPATERVVLKVVQPATNHNGGTVDFGPDGMLYASFGDGGGQGDPFRNGQDLTTLLGTIIRIDVDTVQDGADYGIPSDNPFVGSTGGERPEIWAYGFRNPFKFDVSALGLWVGDVGEQKWEEVNKVEPGLNYGWSQVEGPDCFRSGCNLSAYTPPLLSYGHNDQGGFSITGGIPYQALDSQLDGHYLYGDFVSGRMWALRFGETEPSVLLETFPDGAGGQRRINISSIDEAGGSILVTDYGGTIFKLFPGGTPAEPGPEPGHLGLALAGANPASQTAVRVQTVEPVRVRVFDVRGREVAVLWNGASPPPTLELPSLAPGVYLVRAETARQSAVLRVSVVR